MRRVLVGAWAVLALVGIADARAGVFPKAVITAAPPTTVQVPEATFEFAADRDAPWSTFECRLDSGPWEPCTSPRQLSGLGGGPHRFEVRLVGGLSDPAPARHDWTVDMRTQVTPPPIAVPPAAKPPAPVKPRRPRRRDSRGCAYAANRLGEASASRLRRATVCLLNLERGRRDLRPLRGSGRLRCAAARHARDMVARGYFAHASPEGHDAVDRIRRCGYLRGAPSWTVGEVLAWLGAGASPAAAVRAWMRSRPHRLTILHPAFREVGVGVVSGNPRDGRGGATFAAELGRRSR